MFLISIPNSSMPLYCTRTWSQCACVTAVTVAATTGKLQLTTELKWFWPHSYHLHAFYQFKTAKRILTNYNTGNLYKKNWRHFNFGLNRTKIRDTLYKSRHSFLKSCLYLLTRYLPSEKYFLSPGRG